MGGSGDHLITLPPSFSAGRYQISLSGAAVKYMTLLLKE
jgi:hypothetical protein